MARVLAENIVKRFGKVLAVNDVCMEFQDGQLTVLVGPSGCGKTTLLRIVAGLEDQTSGRIYIGDREVTDVPPWRRNTAMVFQNYALYPHMTVFNNIAYPLRSRGNSKEEIRARVERTAASLGLDELLHRKPRELSGGQMQRVAVGRAIVRQPDVYLMDEPLSNLDAKLRVDMRAELKRLQKDLGVTMIYVTHDQAEAMTMADNLIVMRNGVIMQHGTPQELFQRPKSVFVAGFIGSPSMNFIACQLDGDRRTLAMPTFSYKLTDRLASALVTDTACELVLGVRPEDVLVSAEPIEGGIPARVFVWEPLGRENLVTLRVGDSMLKSLTSPDLQFDLDQEVWLTFNENRLHLFDDATERSVLARRA